MLLGILSGNALANDSACGNTTHGIPLRSKGQMVDPKDPDSYFKTFGPALIEKTVDGAKTSVWYDISHAQSSATISGGTASTRKDCGVMFVLTVKGNNIKTTVKALQSDDIDALIAGKVPAID